MHALTKVILLAILQGVAEFLPVSSSGHLVIASRLLGLELPGLRLETMLHFGTLLAVCGFYRQRLWSLLTGLARREPAACRETGLLLLASLPIVVVHLAAHARIEACYENHRLAAAMLIVTGLLLLSLPFRRLDAFRRPALESVPLGWWRALVIGLAQAVAILPGISRSGATITTARHLGIDTRRAAEFSFLMSVPPLLGATLLHGFRPEPAAGASAVGWGLLGAGTLVAALVGYAAIAFLIRVLSSGRFWIFGVYCLLAGGIVLLSGL